MSNKRRGPGGRILPPHSRLPHGNTPKQPTASGFAPDPEGYIVSTNASMPPPEALTRGTLNSPESEARYKARMIPRARLQDLWNSGLTPQTYVRWERVVTVAESTIAGAATGSEVRSELEPARPDQCRLLFEVAPIMLSGDGGVPSIPNAEMDPGANMAGARPFQLYGNNDGLLNTRFSVFDGTGIVSGGGALEVNRNILHTGQTRNVLFVPENTALTGGWTNAATPSGSPVAFGVRLRGFQINATDYERILEALQFRMLNP